MTLAAIGWLAACTAVASKPADAAFPGVNGKIAYSAFDGSIWAANADGSSAARLTDGSGDWSPTYSPDGSRIAFERGQGIFVMNADGSGQGRLIDGGITTSGETTWEGDYETPGPSPQTIPFVKVQATTTTGHSFGAPSFSPDGSRLAVAEVLEEHKFTVICAVEEDKGEKCIDQSDPDAYVESHLACISCTARIVTISSTSGARTGDVTTPPSGSYDLEPAYSTSGRLAFRREGSVGGSAIFVADSPAAAPTQVTFGESDWTPDFSPDGSKIAFSRGNEIGIVGAAGGPVTIVPVPSPPGAQGFADSPAFSPDGTRIAFERGVFPQGTPGEGLYTIGVDGTGLSLVSSDGFGPSWQPTTMPQPPPPTEAAKARSRKGKVRLTGKGKATIGTITCGSSPCELAVSSAKLKAGKKKCLVETTLAKRLGPKKSAPLGVRVAGKCLAAVGKVGKGKLVAKVWVADAVGRKALTFKATLVSAKGSKSRKAHK